jgi:hypothetical protein
MSAKKELKIANLIDLANSTTSEAEMLASLKLARKLAFKLGIDINDVKSKEVEEEVINTFHYFEHDIPRSVEIYVFDSVISNFPIEYISFFSHSDTKYKRTRIAFYYDKQVSINDVISIIDVVLKFLKFQKNKLLYKYRKQGKSTKDVYQSYCLGFSKTLDLIFKKQNEEYGLIVQTSSNVVAERNQLLESCTDINTRSVKVNFEAYKEGLNDGKNFGRGLEGEL